MCSDINYPNVVFDGVCLFFYVVKCVSAMLSFMAFSTRRCLFFWFLVTLFALFCLNGGLSAEFCVLDIFGVCIISAVKFGVCIMLMRFV